MNRFIYNKKENVITFTYEKFGKKRNCNFSGIYYKKSGYYKRLAKTKFKNVIKYLNSHEWNVDSCTHRVTCICGNRNVRITELAYVMGTIFIDAKPVEENLTCTLSPKEKLIKKVLL